VGFSTPPNVGESLGSVEGVVIRNLGDKRCFGRSTGLFERRIDNDITAEMSVLKAVDNSIPRELVGILREDFFEPLGNLTPDVGDPVRGSDIVVFGPMEHLDGFGVIGTDVLVDQSTNLCLSALGGERQKRRQLGVRRDRTPEFDVCEVGATEREVVLVDRKAVGVILGFDHVGFAVVVLSNGRKLVEPLCSLSGFDAQPRSVDAVKSRKR